MRLTTARDQFLSERKLGNHVLGAPRVGVAAQRPLSPATLQRYYWALTGFIDWLHTDRGKDSVLFFKAEIARAYIVHRSGLDIGMNTLAIDCAALREFARWGAKKRYWRPEDVEDMPAVTRPNPVPRSLSAEERDRVMALPLDGMDELLRGLLYYSGCRESELLSVRLLDLSAPHQLPDGSTVPGAIRVWGKGGKERVVPIHADLWELLIPHRALTGQPRDRHLLCRPDGSPWTQAMVIARAHKWGTAAAVDGLTPHRLRHTFASDLLDADVDLRTIQELLGHASVNTTQIYTRVVDRRRAAAVASLPTFSRVRAEAKP